MIDIQTQQKASLFKLNNPKLFLIIFWICLLKCLTFYNLMMHYFMKYGCLPLNFLDFFVLSF